MCYSAAKGKFIKPYLSLGASNLDGVKLKLDNLKYGFLISVTTMFGGSVSELYAQDDNGKKINVESNEAYKKQFLQSVSPELDKLKVDFVVDSVETKLSNGELLPDVNIIQLLAYLDQDSEEYQSYMASRHIVAHEMWHRICMMNEVLEKPMSATQYRTGRDNFEISASIVQLLTFREDYINATPEQRQKLRQLDDPKIKMYVMAVENDIIRPLSKDKKDFDFEMEFIAKMVSGYWNNNLAVTYAPRHNAMTEKANRKEFKSPVYEKNFTQDIKVMNHIGGIDFSKLYNYKDVRFLKKFKQADKADTNQLEASLSAPNFETWINKKSQLKRFSKQTIQIPNFTGNRLVDEREKRPLNERVQPFQLADISVGYKVYPLMKVPFYSAVTLRKDKTLYNLYPHGALDVIQQPNAQGISKIKTLYLDGAHEEGELKNGIKNGVFRFYDKNKKLIASATFQNNRAIDGQVVLPAAQGFILYTYKDGNLTALEELSSKGVKKTICRIENGRPISGLVPIVDTKDNKIKHSYHAYQDGKLMAALVFDDFNHLKEKQKIKNQTIRVERFYNMGKIKYVANANILSTKSPLPKSKNTIDAFKTYSSDKNPSPKDAQITVATNLRTIQSDVVVNNMQIKTNTLNSSLVAPISKSDSRQQAVAPMVTSSHAHTDFSAKPSIKSGESVAYSPSVSVNSSLKIATPQIQMTEKLNSQTADKSAISDISASKAAISRPVPTISQEVLFAPNGNAVLLSQKTNTEKKSLRVKIKDFFALLTQTPLPKTEKQVLMSEILKMKQKMGASKQPLSQTPRVSPSVSRLSQSSQRKSAQKISLLKNKFRFFLIKQRGIDKA